MHALQHLGEALVGLSPSRLASLALPERLAEAIAEARTITRWEARRRQMQFIGRLMRDVDPEPIQASLDQWADAPNEEKARIANVDLIAAEPNRPHLLQRRTLRRTTSQRARESHREFCVYRRGVLRACR